MALSLATLQAQLDALRTARASGLSRVVVDGIETSWKSDADMAAAEAALLGQISALTTTSTGVHPITRINVAIGSPA